LPGSYNIDTTIAGLSDLSQFGLWTYLDNGFYLTSDARTGYGIYNGTESNKIYYASKVESGTSDWETRVGNAEFGDDTRNLTLMMSVPILGWNSKFTPVLSMPLVDFTTWENTYSAYIPEAGTSVTSQSQDFIASVARPSAGVYTITFKSGHFSEIPAVTATAVKDRGTGTGTANEALSQIKEVSATAVTVQLSNILNSGHGSTPESAPFFIVAQRQGADYKQPPAPSASIIKPSVCLVKDVKASTDNGGATGTQNTWHDRTLNTLEGESWFVNSFSSNVVTLPAGQYDIEVVQMASQCDGWTTRLYNTTDSKTLAPGSSNKATAGAYYANSHIKWSGTFAKATGVKLQYIVESTAGGSDSLGLNAATSGTNSTENSIYAQMKITKLK